MKQTTLLILSLLFFVSASAAYAYLMYEITVAVDSIAQAEGSVTSIGERSAASQAAERFIAETADERAELLRYIVNDADVIQAIEVIEGAARREKIDADISSASTQPLPDRAYHESVQVSFSSEGSYASLVRLASALETLPLAARLERVVFESTVNAWFATYSILIVKEKTP